MIALELLWWAGWLYFAAWVALPLVLVAQLGPYGAAVTWLFLAPWSGLLGMALVHRLLPASEPGRFRMFSDSGSIRWALKGWAPSVYLTVFQPVGFQSPAFQRIVLWAFQARLATGALITSRTVIREPHHVRIGRASLVGEFAHLVCSYQARPGLLMVGDIEIGDGVLVGAYSHIGPGARIASGAILEHDVRVGPQTTIGSNARIGAGSAIYGGVRIGDGACIGKGCLVASGSVVADGARIPDGTVLSVRPSASAGLEAA